MTIIRWLSIATLAATPLMADLILVSPTEMNGTGLGSVNTVLTLSSPANNTGETGCVGLTNTGTVTTTGCGFSNFNVQNQSTVPTLSALGITSASDIRVVFNASEPTSALNIQLNTLVLTLYSADGTATQTHATTSTLFFPTIQNGVGNSGFVFRLTDLEAAAAQSFINANGGLGGVRVGLGASAGCGTFNNTTVACQPSGAGGATGGLETFFVESAGDTGGGTGSAVPEPQSAVMVLLGAGFIFAGALRRKK